MRVTADHLDQVLHPQFAETGKVLAKGLAASPGAAVGKVYFTADEAADAAERGEKVILVRNETSPEDVHGMMVAEGILTARGGLVSPRRRRRPRLGHPRRRRRRGDQDRGRPVPRRRHRRQGGRRHLARRHHRRGRARRDEARGRRSRRPSSTRSCGVGRRGPQGQARRARQRRHRRGRRQCPRVRRRGHRAVPHRAHVPRPGPPAGRAQDDPRPDRRPRKRRRSTSCGRVQQTDFEEILEAMDGLPVTVRLLDPPLHEFLPSVEELRVKEATDGLDRAGAARAEGGRELGRAQPDDRHPRRAPRRDEAGPVRDAGAGAARRGRVAAQAGGNPIVEIMIPLTVTREEMALARRGSRTRSTRRRQGPEEEADDHDRHDDRDATRRAPRRRDRRGGRLLQLRHQRPHADDVRLQPRRHREPDDARLPRAGAAQAEPVRDDRPDRRRRARASSAPSAAGPSSRSSSSACAASTAATPSRSGSSTTPASTTCRCSPFRVPIARLGGGAGGARRRRQR